MPQLTLALKAMMQAEETVRTLDPTLPLVDTAFAAVKELMVQTFDPDSVLKALRLQAVRGVKEAIRNIPSIEEMLTSWLTQLRQGRFTVYVDTTDLSKQIDEVDEVLSLNMRRLSLALLLVGLLIAASIASNTPARPAAWARRPCLPDLHRRRHLAGVVLIKAVLSWLNGDRLVALSDTHFFYALKTYSFDKIVLSWYCTAMTISQISKRESPLWQIIEYLQRNGSATIKELEDLLGVTTTAVRQHLTTLQVEGYIERRVVHSGVGRPHHAYFTTSKVQELFACQCDDLALTLLQEVFHLEGQERALQLLDRVGTRLARKYTPSVRSSMLQERVSELGRYAQRQRRAGGCTHRRKMIRSCCAPLTARSMNWRMSTVKSAKWTPT